MKFVQLPLAPLELTSNLVNHLLTTHLHDHFPYARFAILHAVRVSLVWAGLTKARERDGGKGRVGYLQDLFGYLVIAWGGSTLSSILLSTPPTWFFPTPWIIYPLTHLLCLYSPIPLSRIIVRLIPMPILDIAGAYIDGITRGTTVSLLSSSSLGVWARALVSGLCISGGGWIVQLLNLNGEQWSVRTPAVLKQGAGLLDRLDTWSAVLLSVIYSILTNPTPNSTPFTSEGAATADSGNGAIISPAIDTFIKDLVPVPVSTPLGKAGFGTKMAIAPEMARAVVVVLMGSLLSARVITRTLLPPSSSPSSTSSMAVAVGTTESERGIKEVILDEKEVGRKSRDSTPSKKKSAGTPKKSPRVK